jgi:hypothetical protein
VRVEGNSPDALRESEAEGESVFSRYRRFRLSRTLDGLYSLFIRNTDRLSTESSPHNVAELRHAITSSPSFEYSDCVSHKPPLQLGSLLLKSTSSECTFREDTEQSREVCLFVERRRLGTIGTHPIRSSPFFTTSLALHSSRGSAWRIQVQRQPCTTSIGPGGVVESHEGRKKSSLDVT